ncbi:hypothetical protein GQ53DRAFT_865116 [Thozetella sp. PMI_491]|nr:hypothetical protein GQ53DRAFT_865116 [Thozetella sp. PMI_491]
MMADNDTGLNDPESRVAFIVGISLALTTLSTALTGLRLYTRTVILNAAGLDDVAIAFAQATSADDIVRQCLFAAIQTYIWTLCIVKVALLLQYRRIFHLAWIRKVSLCLIVFSITWNSVQSILCGVSCIPVGLFIPSEMGHCIDSLLVWLTAAIINIITDFMVFVMPLPAIKSLHLPLKQKILLLGVFCLGFFTCVVSIVRATTLHLAMSSKDTSWVGQNAAVWSIVEANCSISCACLPTLKPLISRRFPGLFTQHSITGTYGDQPKALSRSPSIPAAAAGDSFALSLRHKAAHSSSTEALNEDMSVLDAAANMSKNGHNVYISSSGQQVKGRWDIEEGMSEVDSHSLTEDGKILVTTETAVSEERYPSR